MHRKNLLALAVLAIMIAWFAPEAGAQPSAPAPAPPSQATTTSADENNPLADALTLEGFIKSTGVMAYPL
ncbi:MAG: hypothetical protein U0984_04075, partial [Prosthecobacter sp.]|nr:hypothetical protein [Prosthecobacter sp.]